MAGDATTQLLDDDEKFSWTRLLGAGATGAAGGGLSRYALGGVAEHFHSHGTFKGALARTFGPEASRMLQVCFAAGTPLRTPDGSKLIEQFAVGDAILSRSEYDPAGPLAVQTVEEVFERVGQILHVHVGGQVIRTTAEHPFWVEVKGWTAAAA